MCGLVFLYSGSSDSVDAKFRVSSALRQIVHRGPDDEGLLANGRAVLGHRRLSIIDLEASRQPMRDPSGRYAIVYNGEIYNYRELRALLEGRWTFRTSGDTEVVLAGLASQGSAFLDQMEGMWALCLWDTQTESLLIARDRMGKKPLYYRVLPSGFACASELPALAQLDAATWQEDIDSTADYLRYGYYLPGTTAYKNVYEVLPAHCLRWQPNAEPLSRPYWSLTPGEFHGGQEEARDILASTVISAVNRRMVADVPVGAFLSGGVDSSLIVSILAKRGGIRPKTFTIGFADSTFDERQFARQVAAECRTEHFEECLQSYDSDLLRSLVLRHVGQPFADASLLPTAHVSELAAQHVKVALSGDGGDEVFSGYQRYQARAILRWYTRLPALLRKNLQQVLRAIPEPMTHHSRSVLKKAHLFEKCVRDYEAGTPYVAPVLYSRQDVRRIAPDLAGRGHPPPSVPHETHFDDIHTMMFQDALVYLPQDILVKVDRASMAHSLEARAPFLDRRLVEFAFSLPRQWHRRGLRGKRLLHEAFHDLLPPLIWRRRKQGFAVPLHRWLKEAMGAELTELLSQSSAPFRSDPVLAMLQAHKKGQRDHSHRLWALHIYLLWKMRPLEPASQRPAPAPILSEHAL